MYNFIVGYLFYHHYRNAACIFKFISLLYTFNNNNISSSPVFTFIIMANKIAHFSYKSKNVLRLEL